MRTPGELIRAVRNALATMRAHRLPSGQLIRQWYEAFLLDVADVCAEMQLDHEDLGHRDLMEVIVTWLKRNPAVARTSPSLS